MEGKAVCAQDNFYDHKNKRGGYNGMRHLAQGPKLIAIIFQMCNICSRVIIVQHKKTIVQPYKNVYLYLHLQ